MLNGVKEAGISVSVIAASAVSSIRRQDCGDVVQWLVPVRERVSRDGLPSRATIRRIQELVEELNPDLVHVWGTEFYWGLLTGRRLINRPTVLTVQGVRYRIAPRYSGDMTLSERLRATGIREVAKLFLGKHTKRGLTRAEPLEREILRTHRVFCCQSPWQAAQVLDGNARAEIQQIDLPLRGPFLETTWERRDDPPTIFCSSSSPSPAKGFHVALRAIAILKSSYPGIQLRIACGRGSRSIFGDGYSRWLDREVGRLKLQDNVSWLDSLPASEMASELQRASACVLPTFIESYSMAMAEAMAVGTPIVATFTGGTSYLGADEQNCLFFPLGDDAMCAYQLRRILADQSLATRLSFQSRRLATERHQPQCIVEQHLHLYGRVVAEPPSLGAR